MQILRADWTLTAEGLRSDVGVLFDAGLIVGLLGPDRQSPVPDASEMRLPGKILLPGLVDVHSHAFQRAFRGQVQWKSDAQDDFWTWRQAMYQTANHLDPDGIFAVSRLAFLEAARAGVTKIGEFHYLHHAPDGARYDDPDLLAKRVIDAALDVGIRITLLRTVYLRHSPGRALQDDQRRFGDRSVDDALAAVARLRTHPDPRVTVGIAPHSIRAVPPDALRSLGSFAGPIHAHVAEQPGEVAACRAETGRTPLQVFADAGLVDGRFTAVHLTQGTDEDFALVRASGASIAVCPSTELDLGDGFLPLAARDGIRLGIGADSHAHYDRLADARAVELHARGLAGRRNVMVDPGDRHGLAERILRIATTDGDRMLGGAGAGIAIGAPADLVAIDLTCPEVLGVPPLEAAAFVGAPVTDVWVGGARIVEGGRHPKHSEILRDAARAMDHCAGDRGSLR